MVPTRFIGFALLAGGIVLVIMGIREADSFGSQFKEFFTGSPTDRAIWLFLGGVVAICAGAAAARLPTRSSRH